MTRNTISDSMFGARPHSHDAITNSRMLPVKSRTWPKRWVSQPVSGTEIALATANEVMTQVPCDGLTPRSPEIAGIETLAIDVSRTFMNVASESATVPRTSSAPCSGGVAGGAAAAGADAGGAAAAGEIDAGSDERPDALAGAAAASDAAARAGAGTALLAVAISVSRWA